VPALCTEKEWPSSEIQVCFVNLQSLTLQWAGRGLWGIGQGKKLTEPVNERKETEILAPRLLLLHTTTAVRSDSLGLSPQTTMTQNRKVVWWKFWNFLLRHAEMPRARLRHLQDAVFPLTTLLLPSFCFPQHSLAFCIHSH
jgi:hypothetical protein